MHLSMKSKNALKVMIDLAYQNKLMTVSELSRRNNISTKYLEQIIASLKSSNLVISTRGANGGYRLAKLSNEIYLGDILRSQEGNLDVTDCLGLCSNHNCSMQQVFIKMNEAINNVADSYTLKDIIDKQVK